MKLNEKEIQDAVNEVFMHHQLFLFDRGDFVHIFPSLTDTKCIRVGGDSCQDVVSKVKEDLGTDFNPARLFVVYISRELTKSDVDILNQTIGQAPIMKCCVTNARYDYGAITVYVFYQQKPE